MFESSQLSLSELNISSKIFLLFSFGSGSSIGSGSSGSITIPKSSGSSTSFGGCSIGMIFGGSCFISGSCLCCWFFRVSVFDFLFPFLSITVAVGFSFCCGSGLACDFVFGGSACFSFIFSGWFCCSAASCFSVVFCPLSDFSIFFS